MNIPPRVARIAAVFCCLSLSLPGMAPSPAAGEELPPPPSDFSYLSDTYDFHIGLFTPLTNTRIQVNPSSGAPGTVLDLENDFGLPARQSRLWFEFNYRLGAYSKLGFIFFEIDRSATRAADRTIQFGNATYAASSVLSAFSTTRYYWLTYQYLLARNPYNEFGLSAGIMTAQITSGLSLQASAIGGTVDQNVSRSSEVSFLAPIPVIGIFLSSQFLPRVFFNNTIRALDINIAGYSADMLNYMVSLDYAPFPSWGLGAGYYFNRLQINKGFTDFDGDFTTSNGGATLYLRYFFT